MIAATPDRRQRLGAGLIASGLMVAVLSAVLLVRPAGAVSTVLVADSPMALAIEVSKAMVPAKDAGGVLLVDASMPPATWGAPAALATFPGSASLLLTPPGSLDATVAAEIDRALAPNGVVYVLGMPDVAAAVAARGWSVMPIEVTTPAATSLALADQTWGVPGGTTQRVLAVSGVDGAHLLAGAANVHGVNLAIPVIAMDRGESANLPTFMREHLLVADAADLADGAVSSQGSPTITRIHDADPATVAASLAQLMDDDPKDGLLEPRLGRTVVAVEVGESRPQPALLAAVVAARDSLDGFNAAIAFVDGPADVAALDAGNGATFLGLGATAPAPPPAPLPVTGGGLALGAIFVVLGAWMRKA